MYGVIPFWKVNQHENMARHIKILLLYPAIENQPFQPFKKKIKFLKYSKGVGIIYQWKLEYKEKNMLPKLIPYLGRF